MWGRFIEEISRGVSVLSSSWCVQRSAVGPITGGGVIGQKESISVADHPVGLLASALGPSPLTQSVEVVCSLSSYSSYRSAFDSR